MAEKDGSSMKRTSEATDEVTKEKEADISRYFESASRTIFDEIVPSKKDDFFAMQRGSGSRIPDFELMADRSTEFLKSNTLLDNERLDHSAINDTHRDVWIPSEQTRKVLRSIATSTTGTSSLDRENLTMPGLAVQGEMPDLIKSTAIHLLGEDENIHRNVLTASDVTQDERGLRNLIQAGCYKAAINLSGKLLAVYAQGYGKINQPSKHTPHSLQLWYTRLALLTKLRQIDILENEAKPFGNLDKPDMYFTFYPDLYGTRPGSMASFSFRLLLAEIPLYCGKPKQALDNLYKVLATVNQIIANFNAGFSGDGSRVTVSAVEQEDAVRLWKGRRSRVLISITNCAVTMKNYVLAINILEKLCDSPVWSLEQLDTLQSSIGRLHLFLGDVSAAEKLLTKGHKRDSELTVREWMDRGLMAVAYNMFEEAYKCFEAAAALEPSNIASTNNMAVCLLYMGQLKDAVHLYESAITKNPVKSLQEPILLNICSAYELHTTHCEQPKLHLLSQLNRYKGDAVDIQCLKLAL
ncbi:Trafficking protein particle complex subunit 12 [Dufourea novaeangliae]|uniref:Trafficking protein particle complex subunit 12 n=2 Tax=Dufourea novaeangliae TaxID=178035 RepID=A0A154PEY2_DUFNO|nr:Trafficking protein particle complex subunit 12 [Dufourea novaeangliae]